MPPISKRFAELGVFKGTKHGAPNHVLINEYNPGEGIMPHEDGPAYSPVVATISLGAPIVLDSYKKISNAADVESGNDVVQDMRRDEQGRPVPDYRILQEPRSLLITTDDAYEVLLHGISSITDDENLGSEHIANWTLIGNPADFPDGKLDRKTRISLTYRDVLKVNKIGVGIFGRR